MKGKALVIGIVLFVVLVVGSIYFAMMATINNIKEEGALPASSSEIYEENHTMKLTFSG